MNDASPDLGLRLRGLSTAINVRAFRGLARLFSNAANWCSRKTKGPQGAKFLKSRLVPAHIPWRTLMLQLGNQAAIRALVGSGAIGNDFPRLVGPPSARRILVLAAHQDDETLGAGGTFLLCARAGAKFCVVYSTDGETPFGGRSKEVTSAIREAEAIRVWRHIGNVNPTFWRYPNRAEEMAPDAGERLSQLITQFEPDAIFLPSFLEQPLEHRRLNDVLLSADLISPIPATIQIWGYQITTRAPGSVVVDVTEVAKEKQQVNRMWVSQNCYLDYPHLSDGRDIAATYYLKGHDGRAPRPRAETFLAFPAREYLRLAGTFIELPKTPEQAATMRQLPSPDFFIVGLQKSGSYWVTALLDAHPSIRCFPSRPGMADGSGEAHLFDLLAKVDDDFESFCRSMQTKLDYTFADIVPQAKPRTAAERMAAMKAFRDRFNQYCHLQRMRFSKPMIGEKTTETVHHPELVEELYPGVRKICILRDPRDRCVSFYFHQLRKGRLASGEPLSDAFVSEYVARVCQDYEGLLKMAGPLHVLCYEKLSTDTELETQRLLRFLRLPDEPKTARSMVEAASFERLAGRPEGEEQPANHFRKGIVGDWRTHLGAPAAKRMVENLNDLTQKVETKFGLDLSSYRS